MDSVTKTDVATPVFAGLLTGVIYKSTSGVRGAALSGLIGIAASCVYWYGGPVVLGSFQSRSGGRR